LAASLLIRFFLTTICGPSPANPRFQPKSAVFLHLVHASEWVHIWLAVNASPYPRKHTNWSGSYRRVPGGLRRSPRAPH